MLKSEAQGAARPSWGQEVTLKMQCVLEDRTVVEKDCKLVFVIGEGDVNQVNHWKTIAGDGPTSQNNNKDGKKGIMK